MRTMECEALILGGGFSGTLLASLLARRGTDVVVLEKKRHPRFAIGESSTPLANQMLRRLAIDYDLPRLAEISRFGSWRRTFPHVTCGLKRGFAYFRHRAEEPFRSVERANELLVAASVADEVGDTQWLRADVDRWFAELARGLDVPIWEACHTRSIQREKDGWCLKGTIDGQPFRCRCRGWLFDATGPAALVARTQGATITTAGFRTLSSAVYTHLEGLRRWETSLAAAGVDIGSYPFRCDDAAVHHLVDEGWIWQLRFVDGRVSIGLVRPMAGGNRDTTVDDWLSCVTRYPTLRHWLSPSELAAEPGCWVSTGPLQRRLTRVCGDHWVALPHTYAFVDPFYSSGIAWTLCGVARLAEWYTASSGGSHTRAAPVSYARALQREAGHLDRLIAMAYAAMSSADLFHAAAMVYFAATTRTERTSNPSEIGFLSAGDDEFVAATEEIARTVDQVRLGDETSVREVAGWIERRLEPFNQVGLFRPPEPNLYWETAAPP